MSVLDRTALPDVQAQSDGRGVVLDEVGIANARVPLRVAAGAGAEPQSTVATLEATVEVSAAAKGTHMSRFVEAVNAELGDVAAGVLDRFAAGLLRRLDSERARVELRFPFFLERAAPVSGLGSLVDFDATLVAQAGPEPATRLGVRAPITSLCPCSREISDYGAHNQRGYVELNVETDPTSGLWLDDLVAVAEAAASSPVYSLLKRVDERHVTMAAYDRPAFVEDIARDVAVALGGDVRVGEYAVRVTNLESIHSHDAVAVVRGRGGA